jgi:hypothetical protein
LRYELNGGAIDERLGIVERNPRRMATTQFAKRTIIAALALGLVVGFGAGTWWWSGTVSTLRERVALF